MIEYETDEETDETEEVDLINVENKKARSDVAIF